ncbi:MAG: RNA polymerase sigma factor [Actinobacteria bacterium]|nr:MAG: RNA polymerase sigma factor [Actinomycetota bacterium]
MSGRDLDDALVDGIRERSETAFSTVYRLVASDLVSFAFGMLHDRGAAEDAVQQAFLELARAAPGIEGDARSLRAWLYRSVRFSCLDELRRRTRRPETVMDPLPEPGSPAGEPDLPDPDLRRALMELSERQRAIVLLRHVTGFSVDEVAEILQTNRTAVYAASARAERRLRKRLAAVESGGGAASPSVETPERNEDTR